MLISIHTPKCGGASLKLGLQKHYGVDRVYLDYDDRPLDNNSPMNRNPELFFNHASQNTLTQFKNKNVIHGHFNVRKYDGFKNAMRVTILRHPVKRLISHYFFWKSKPSANNTNLIRKRVYEKKISFTEFSKTPSLRWLYTHIFFGGVNMDIFDFIGCFENPENDVPRLSNILNIDLPIKHENKNMFENYNSKIEEITSDRKLMVSLENTLIDDIRFYEKNVSKFM